MLRLGKGTLRSALLAALLATFLISTAIADETTTLGPGSQGEAVVSLKTELKEKGYYTVKNDKSNAYTSSLKSAVGVFQIANNIDKPKEGYGYANVETQALAASDDAIIYTDYRKNLQLQPGGRGSYVTETQRKLKKLGYYTGKIDGRYRSSTEAAVKFFQTANDLPITGKADIGTRAKLYSTDPAPITRAQYEDKHNLSPLSYGAKGDQVTHLQKRLAAKGFYWGDPTGVYDTQTRYSVKFFQEANGYSASGSVSRTLRTKINNDAAVSFEAYAKSKSMDKMQLYSGSKPGIKIAVLQLKLRELGYYNGIITGTYSSSVITAVKNFQIFNYPTIKSVTGKADTATRTLMNSATAVKFSTVCGDNTLRPGAKGEDVKNLQTKLKELGYYKGDINGVYGSVVTSAVKVFQKYNGIYPSGVAYTQTLTTLNSGTAKSYSNVKIEKLIAVADKLMDAGAKYSTNPRAPYSFDCSRFTAYCLKQVGVYVSGEIRAQGRSNIGTKITLDDPKKNSSYYKALKKGDLLFFWSPDRKKKPGHSAIYLGNNKFIHASSSAGKVTVSGFRTYNERSGGPWFLWAIRIWE